MEPLAGPRAGYHPYPLSMMASASISAHMIAVRFDIVGLLFDCPDCLSGQNPP